MSCDFCHYFKKGDGDGEKGGGQAMQSNRFQGWLLLHKATCGHSHLAEKFGIWNFSGHAGKKNQASEHAQERQEGHYPPSSLPAPTGQRN